MRLPLRRKRPSQPAGGPAVSDARLERAERQVRALRRRVVRLEREVLESRQLNKQVAEMIDVVGEVLLPAGQRDEQRLHELLKKYDASL
jgi:hypothetical protein